MKSVWRVAAMLGLLAAIATGCGDDTSGDNAASSTTEGASPTSPDPDGATSDDSTASADDGGSSPAGETYAMVAVDGETFEFFMDGDNGICNPDLVGIFQASLYQEGNPEGAPGLQLSIRPDDDGGLPESLVRVGQVWIADPGYTPGTQVDSATIDGNHVEGTATFANADDSATVSGTFEVTCAST